MKHEITIDDFKDYVMERELAGSHGKGSNKTLYVKINIDTMEAVFIVKNHGEISKEIKNIEEAVEIYNSFE